MFPEGPSILRYFATKWMLKNPKGSPIYIFRHYETVQNYHFSSDIRFISRYIFTNISFSTIRTFDVISKIYCVLLRRRRRFKKSARSCLSTLYPNFCVFRAPKASFGCFDFFCVFYRKNVLIIFCKVCAF